MIDIHREYEPSTQPRRRAERASKRAAFALLAALAVSPLGPLGCSDSSGSTSSSSGSSSSARPWTRQFMFGNTSINTGDVVTNQDGVSADYLTDYIEESKLPNANFEVFTTHFYLPSTSDIEPSVGSSRVTVSRTDGSSTDDIHQKTERIERTTVGGETYTVYRVTGFTTADPPITRSDFANVVFQVFVSYEGGPDATKKVEVYKR